MTVEFRFRKVGDTRKLTIANTSTKLLTHVKWWISPWAETCRPDTDAYWSLAELNKTNHMPALHAGVFDRGHTIPVGDYRVEWLFATPDGESHHEVQHLSVE